MDETLLSKWNNRVKASDKVFVIGDFAFGDPTTYLKRLSGKIILISGNHDRKLGAFKRMNIEIYEDLTLIGEKVTWFMSHRVRTDWPGKDDGVYHLFGHHHGRRFLPVGSKMLDVGVDSHGFAPITLDDAYELIRKRMFSEVPVDGI
jgi:calcineurin-like phosphoesterase family protein